MKGIDFQVLVNNLFNAEYETNAYTWYSYYLDGNALTNRGFSRKPASTF